MRGKRPVTSGLSLSLSPSLWTRPARCLESPRHRHGDGRTAPRPLPNGNDFSPGDVRRLRGPDFSAQCLRLREPDFVRAGGLVPERGS